MTEINIQIKFKEYQFCRVKPTTNGALAHMNKEWIGRKVAVIPVPMTVTDRLIEANYNTAEESYVMNFKDTIILNKEVKASTSTGRIYLPKEWIGLDVLITEEPTYDYI